MTNPQAFPPIAYYRIPDPMISFYLVANHHLASLREMGFRVAVQDLRFPQFSEIPPARRSIAVMHPLFYYRNWGGMSFDDLMCWLHQRHEFIFGMEVGDSTSISSRFVQWANHPQVNGIMLPSRCAIEAFRQSGVRTLVGLVPHGVKIHRASDRFLFLRDEKRTKVLTFRSFDFLRKGWDLVFNLIPRFPEALFIIKGPPTWALSNVMPRVADVLIVNDWLSEEDLASLYENCDVLLSLHRGGAFELSCLEALAYGLPVIATAHGGVMDYLDESNAFLVRVGRLERLYPEGFDHSGLGATADVGDAVRRLREVLSDLRGARERVRTATEEIKRMYSWNGITGCMIEFMARTIGLGEAIGSRDPVIPPQ